MATTTKTFTVWCRESNGTGTTFIDTVESADRETAKVDGVRACADAWGWDDTSGITCIGVAEGDVNVLFWEDI